MPVLFPKESRSGLPNSGIPYDKSTLTLSVDTQASLTQTRFCFDQLAEGFPACRFSETRTEKMIGEPFAGKRRLYHPTYGKS